MKRIGLRSQLLMSVSALILISVTLLAIASFKSAETQITSALGEQLFQTADMAKRQVNAWMITIIGDVKIQADRNTLRQALSVKGDQQVFVQANAAFRVTADQKMEYETMGLAGADGIVIAGSDSATIGKLNISDRAYFKSSMQGQSVVSEILLSKTTGNAVFVVSEPVRVNNQVLGVVFYSVALDSFYQKQLSAIKPMNSGYAYLLNSGCVLIAHPDRSAVLKTNLCDLGFGKELLAKKNGLIHYVFNGTAKTVAFATDDLSTWLVGITVNDADIAAAATPVRNLCLTLGCILLVFGIVTAWFIARSVLLQLGKDPSDLVVIVDQVAEGNLNPIVDQSVDGGVYGKIKKMLVLLRNKEHFAKGIAGGDLSQTFTLASDKDDLGRSLKDMSVNLNDIVLKIREAANQLASGSSEVSAASQSLSQGTTEQAAALEEISASVNDLSSQVSKNASDAAEASGVAMNARESATRGKVQIEQTVSAMTEINKSSQDISKIIKVIDDIAFQTNLLALNAAVEAARAGQHGKGFAVVADEVRNLAGRCATAAMNVDELIAASAKKVENGLNEASRTAESFKEIVDGAVKVAALVDRISTASGMQASALAQISEGVNQVSKATQQATANAEETAAASEELSAQGGELKNIIRRFQVKEAV